jgi:general secretion pathway protein K
VKTGQGSPRRGVAPRPERGFALLIVLWTLVPLALLITQLAAAGRGEARLTRNLLDAATAEAAADGAVFEAVSRLLDANARHWASDGGSHALRLERTDVAVRIEDESGKINPNEASSDLLTALLRAVGLDTRASAGLALAIARWRFPSGQTAEGETARGEGAASAYRAAGRRYAPPEAPFQSLDELGLVLGMTPDLLARLRPHLTLYHAGDPDPRAADPVVAAALRLLTDTAIRPPSDSGAGRVVTIVATAAGANNSRFTRRAVVRVGAAADGGAYRILEWDRGGD